jgi:type I restriction enzyme S subunit
MKFLKDNIRDIATQIKTGKTPSTTVSEYFNGDINWYTPSDLSKEIYLGKSNRTITEKAIHENKATVFDKDTVLISCIGDIGKLGIVTESASSNQQITGVKLNKKVFPLFFYYWCKRNKSLLVNKSRQAILPILNNEILGQIKISYPENLDDQIRIATVLIRAEQLISKRKESIKALDELLKSTFLEMFGDKQGTTTVLGNVIEIQNGQVHPKNMPYSEMYHVGGANIESETGKLINLKQAKFENLISGKYLFTEQHILYSKIRPYLNKVAIPDFTGICSADIYPIKPKHDYINKQFLRFILMSKQFLGYTDNNSDRANIPKINRKALVLYSFTLPPLPLQNRFAAIVEKVESLKSKYTQSLTELEKLYGSLSQRAFKGELDLSGVLVEKEEQIAEVNEDVVC